MNVGAACVKKKVSEYHEILASVGALIFFFKSQNDLHRRLEVYFCAIHRREREYLNNKIKSFIPWDRWTSSYALTFLFIMHIYNDLPSIKEYLFIGDLVHFNIVSHNSGFKMAYLFPKMFILKTKPMK